MNRSVDVRPRSRAALSPQAEPVSRILGDVTWSGDAVIEPGRLIFSGRLGTAHRHAHAAVQIAAAHTGAVTFSDAAGQQVQAGAAVIPPGVEHAVDAGTASGVMIYLEPTSMVGRRFTGMFNTDDRGDARAWVTAARPCVKLAMGADISVTADDVLRQLLGSAPQPLDVRQPHPSVRAAIDLLPRMLAGPVRLGDVARAVHLSADRLGRLFARDVGMSFPAYVRWARLVRALEVARDGGTITELAHAAGFSDSSHANRAFHEMFGIAPVDVHRGVRLS